MKQQTRMVRPGGRRDASPLRSSKSMPLPEAERTFFESRLGHDFSRVRVHTDGAAATAAAALGAKAFALGDDIAFAADRYRPGTTEGHKLMAHELVHVAQQERGGGTSAQTEARASAAAERVAQGESVPAAAQGGAAFGLHCDPDDDKKKPDDAPIRSVVFRSPAGAASPLQPPGLSAPSLLQPPSLLPSLGAPGPGPLLPPFKLMSNADILAPFSSYGVTPSQGGFDIQGDWAMAFWTFRNYMPESLAALSANTFLPAAYKATLGFNQPSIFDKSDIDLKAAFPNEKHIPPIPLISSGTLTKLYESISGKKDTNKFYF